MQCSECNVEMEKGQLSAHANVWQRVSSWMHRFIAFDKKLGFNPIRVYAYLCHNCNKIELRAET